GEARVSPHAFDLVLTDVAVAAQDLYGGVARVHACHAALQLGHGGGLGVITPQVAQCGSLSHEQPSRLQLRSGRSDLERHGLVAHDRASELLALGGVPRGYLERGPAKPDAHGSDADPPAGEHLSHVVERLTACADEL